MGIIKSLRDTKPLDSFRCQKTIEYGEQKFDERINLACRMFIHLWITDRILRGKHHEEGWGKGDEARFSITLACANIAWYLKPNVA